VERTFHCATAAVGTFIAGVADTTRAVSVCLAIGCRGAREATSIAIATLPLVDTSACVTAHAAQIFKETIIATVGNLTIDSLFATSAFETPFANANTGAWSSILTRALGGVTTGLSARTNLAVVACVAIQARAL